MRSGAEQQRRFGYALGVSVVVHAAVLYGGLPLLRESFEEPVAPPPLVTRMVELPKPAAEPAPAPSPPPEEKKAPRPRREPDKREAVKPLPQPSPIAEPAPSAPPSEPAPSPPVVAAPQAAPATAQPSVDTRAVEAETAAQYRMQLIAYAQRNKPPYPRIARENNWTGDVTLEISLRADGQAELGLRRGSGHPVLDQLALDTYQQELRAVPVPRALQGKPVRLQPLRVIYNLTEN